MDKWLQVMLIESDEQSAQHQIIEQFTDSGSSETRLVINNFRIL